MSDYIDDEQNEMLDDILERGDLTEWERNFAESLDDRRQLYGDSTFISNTQADKLAQIYYREHR